jgi:broad specificity phosphatase PhoE
MPSVTLIRHAESQANHDGIWNGRIDGPLSPRGEASLEHLHARLTGRRFDLVISSPFERAQRTAACFADDYEISEEFIELDIGHWEGMTHQEILTYGGDRLREAIYGRELPMGETGESLNQMHERVIRALDALIGRLGDDGHAVVVTHGGVIQEALQRHLAGRSRRVHAYVANTSITKLVWSYGRPRLAVFNDLGHFGPRSPLVESHLEQGDPVLALVRHGRTKANIEGRWQGQGDWGLDEVGHQQAAALGDWYGPVATVYSSPLGRARATAGYLASNGVVTMDGLKELGMGEWEGLTSDEIHQRWPDLLETIYRDGVDLKRGGTGESWGEMTGRFRATIEAVRPTSGEPTAVVAHGGVIRAYVSSLTATTDSHSESLYTPQNASVTHVAMTDEGPLLLDYSVSTHLESLPGVDQ